MLDFLSHTLDDVVMYAGLHPWYFILCALLCLAPFFASSVYFSRQLANNIDQKLADRRIRLKHLLESHEVEPLFILFLELSVKVFLQCVTVLTMCTVP
jgi:Uncharacterised protein family UPF0542